MKEKDSSRDLLAAWVNGVCRRPVLVLFACLALAAGLLWIAATSLTINTSTEDMLSAELPWRQNNRAVDRAFPQLVDSLTIAVEGPDALAAEEAAGRLAQALRARDKVFHSVLLPEGGDFFRRNGLLYLSPEDLQAESDRLAAAQPLLAALQEDPSLRGLADLLIQAFDSEDAAADRAELGPLLARLAATAEALPDNPAARLSWSALMSGGPASGEGGAPADHRRFLIAKPVIDFATLEPMAAGVAAVEKAAEDLGLTAENGYRLRLTGEALMLQDELASVRSGIGVVGLISGVLVAIVLFAGLRSWRLVLPILVTLVAGLAWTAGFAALAVGELNLISVAFAVLFIGLSVDFGIHYALRVQENAAAGREPLAALTEAAALTGRPLLLCAVSSALAFFAFFPTAYRGLSELGLIAGTGMFIALFLNLTLLPALMRLLPARAGAVHLGPLAAASAGLQRRAGRHAGLLAGLGVALALAAAFALPQARFDDDPLNLRDPDSPSVAALLELLDDARVSPYSAQVLSDGLEQARAEAARLEALPQVSAAVTLDAFVPAEQDLKLDIIDQTALLLTPLFTAPPPLPAPDASERAAALERLKAALQDPPAEVAGEAARLAAALSNLGPVTPAQLEAAWLGGFDAALNRLLDALEAQPVTLDDLPAELRRRYEAPDGRMLIEVIPEQDLRDPAARERFVAAVQAEVPKVSGVPVTIVEAGWAVVTAFVEATVLALCAIALLLLLVLRSPLDTLLVLLPLSLAALLTVAAGVVFDLPFNFANVIVLPLLLGLGVDSGIHYVMRAREEKEGAVTPTNSTPRAIFLSALTTLASFGALSLSQHPGTASMGLLLTVAIVITLVCVLAFLPALLALAGRLPRG
ncbi:MMPL family transporter [Pelagibius marinus]|uniref:MMPL family transporter n=1 Tax=Pelagibius marinus TaxID=2762760 RepID=UPI001872D07F|nr:MMPL family transporter [Pelagibius marinus]